MSQQEAENHGADSHCPLQEEPEKSAVVEIPFYRTHGISPIPSSSILKPYAWSPAPQPNSSTPVPDHQSALSPKKRLTLSSFEKERLLNWDVATPGTFSSTTTAIDIAGKYSRGPGNSAEPEPRDPEPRDPEPGLSAAEPEHSPPLSSFQLWASTLRRSFSKAGNNPKVIRRNRPPRARPLSEGSFSFSSLFGVSAQDQEDDVRMRSRADTEGNQSRTAGRSEITAMLEQVTLNSKPSGASKDDMTSLPPRKLNFFSSMRLKRNQGGVGSKTDDQAKDVWSILSKFRSKGVSKSLSYYEKLNGNVTKHPIII